MKQQNGYSFVEHFPIYFKNAVAKIFVNRGMRPVYFSRRIVVSPGDQMDIAEEFLTFFLQNGGHKKVSISGVRKHLPEFSAENCFACGVSVVEFSEFFLKNDH